MEPISFAFILSAFVAGLLTFLAPCTLPLVPAYIGFISGVSTKELDDPSRAREARRKIIANGVAFIIGFSVVFIAFGTLAGVLGQTLAPFRTLFGQIGGALVIFFGLFMLGAFRLSFLQTEKRLRAPSFLSIGKPSSSLAIGSAFAFGWTPCVGPILGTILLFASTSQTALQGAFLLAVFSLGLALPFLLVTVGIGAASRSIAAYFRVIKEYRAWILGVAGFLSGFLYNLVALVVLSWAWKGAGAAAGIPFAAFLIPAAMAFGLALYGARREVEDPVSVVAGIFLLPLGFLLATGNFALTIQYGYQFFDFINYEGLLDYL